MRLLETVKLRKRLFKKKNKRLSEILNYIHTHYLTVTLDELSGQFYLSKPYLSKYIKEQSGKTFSCHVREIRLQRAAAMLRHGSATVEKISAAAGYQNVEHFNRQFKKTYKMTPLQYRNQNS